MTGNRSLEILFLLYLMNTSTEAYLIVRLAVNMKQAVFTVINCN
jgi:hypothetical protein